MKKNNNFVKQYKKKITVICVVLVLFALVDVKYINGDLYNDNSFKLISGVMYQHEGCFGRKDYYKRHVIKIGNILIGPRVILNNYFEILEREFDFGSTNEGKRCYGYINRSKNRIIDTKCEVMNEK